MAYKREHNRQLRARDIETAVIGLGLMGHSIIACLLAAGHRVTGLSRSLARHRDTRRHVLGLLREMKREGLLKREPAALIKNLTLTEDYAAIARCGIVIESILEDIETKKDAYRRAEAVVPPDAIIASNTSAIPLSVLQTGAQRPERFVGLHWDEPAHITRFMEVVAGEKTGPAFAERAAALARLWGKEPSLVRRDVRGFIANRVSYAMFREACHLVESGIATVEDVDRSLRNDVGWWIPFAGPFRYMDLMGCDGYYRVAKDLMPDLSASSEIPALMRQVVEAGGKGISNGRGYYRYSPAEAKRWEKLFLKFNYEIRRLAMKYPEDAGNRSAKPKRRRAARSGA